MRILCVCQAGNVRSVALAWILKGTGADALACGIAANSRETLETLFRWADRIAAMEPWIADEIPIEFSEKVTVVDVGPDVWLNPAHPELLRLVRRRAAEAEL